MESYATIWGTLLRSTGLFQVLPMVGPGVWTWWKKQTNQKQRKLLGKTFEEDLGGNVLCVHREQRLLWYERMMSRTYRKGGEEMFGSTFVRKTRNNKLTKENRLRWGNESNKRKGLGSLIPWGAVFKMWRKLYKAEMLIDIIAELSALHTEKKMKDELKTSRSPVKWHFLPSLWAFVHSLELTSLQERADSYKLSADFSVRTMVCERLSHPPKWMYQKQQQHFDSVEYKTYLLGSKKTVWNFGGTEVGAATNSWPTVNTWAVSFQIVVSTPFKMA